MEKKEKLWFFHQSMLKFIRRLQKKPETTRQRVALTFTLLITALIILVWLSVLYANSLKEEETMRDTSDPLQLFSNQLQEGWQTLRGEYNTTK